MLTPRASFATCTREAVQQARRELGRRCAPARSAARDLGASPIRLRRRTYQSPGTSR